MKSIFELMKKYAPYSYSKIGVFHTCPQKFKFKYVDKIKIPQKPTPALEKGLYIHALIEKYLFKYIANNYQELDPQIIIDENPQLGIKKLSEEQNATLTEQAREIFKTFVTSERFKNILNTSDIIYPEMKMDIVLENKKYFTAYVDAYSMQGNNVTIYDWKTGSTNNYTGEQLCTYFLLANFINPNLTSLKIVYVLIEQEGADIEYNIELSSPEVQKTLTWLSSSINEIESCTTFSLTSNPSNCNFCEFSHLCSNNLSTVLKTLR